MADLNPFAPPAHDEPHLDRALPQEARFFLVSRTKFIVMCLATFGLYEVYWFYKHWKLTKDSIHSDIWPLPRAIFAVFFTHALLRDVKLAAAYAGVKPSFQVQSSAWGFIILSLLYRLPDPFWLVSMLSFLPLIPVQDTINETYRRIAPNANPNASFSLGNWVAIFVGGAFLALGLLTVLFPEEQFRSR
ncbi:MAG: hypothetical protein JW940_29475 [Polyangiaceae bacterium]|nr:hypothetical protein [Polyangiaceae bacterium]